MSVSLAGLDLSFLKDPANRLPPRQKKQRIDFGAKRSDVASPYFVGDIKPFISNATRETVEITSRSALRDYERANDIRQCGDYKPGEIVAHQNKSWQQATTLSEAEKQVVDFKWTD